MFCLTSLLRKETFSKTASNMGDIKKEASVPCHMFRLACLRKPFVINHTCAELVSGFPVDKHMPQMELLEPGQFPPQLFLTASLNFTPELEFSLWQVFPSSSLFLCTCLFNGVLWQCHPRTSNMLAPAFNQKSPQRLMLYMLGEHRQASATP